MFGIESIMSEKSSSLDFHMILSIQIETKLCSVWNWMQ
jgi:hypothetical protein